MKKLGLLLILAFLALVGIHFLLAPKTDEFAEADALDEIRKRGVIKIGVNTDLKPYAYLDAKGNHVGFDIDLAHYIAQYIVNSPDNVEFIPVTHSNRLMKASTGEADIVISTITITPQREEIVSFSVPYDYAGQAVLVKSNSVISSLSDLSEQNVGVIFGSTAEKNMKNLLPNANLFGFNTYKDASDALKKGDINAITSDDTILNGLVIDDKSLKLLPKRYSKEPYGIAFKKGYSTIKLKENVDFVIEDLYRKNVLLRLRKKWGII